MDIKGAENNEDTGETARRYNQKLSSIESEDQEQLVVP